VLQTTTEYITGLLYSRVVWQMEQCHGDVQGVHRYQQVLVMLIALKQMRLQRLDVPFESIVCDAPGHNRSHWNDYHLMR
jgi:hypothetical protein